MGLIEANKIYRSYDDAYERAKKYIKDYDFVHIPPYIRLENIVANYTEERLNRWSYSSFVEEKWVKQFGVIEDSHIMILYYEIYPKDFPKDDEFNLIEPNRLQRVLI